MLTVAFGRLPWGDIVFLGVNRFDAAKAPSLGTDPVRRLFRNLDPIVSLSSFGGSYGASNKSTRVFVSRARRKLPCTILIQRSSVHFSM